MEEIILQRGHRNLQMDGAFYHSSYDPVTEADRLIASLDWPDARYALVLGEGLGYVSQALLRTRPGVRVLPFCVSRAARLAVEADGLTAWSPDLGPAGAWLGQHVPRELIDAAVPVVLPQFPRLFPQLARQVDDELRAFFRQEQGSLLTIRHFGRRWLANALRNLQTPTRAVRLWAGTEPVVLAAAGPSLAEALQDLEPYRGRFRLWVLSSALQPVLARGWQPDLVVAIDGGYWARPLLADLRDVNVPLATSLFSAPLHSGQTVVWLNQGTGLETALYQAAGLEALTIPTQGTVAVTALQLARQATTGPVWVAGLDLAWRGLRAHLTPHQAERGLEVRHNRLAPLEGLLTADRLMSAPVQLPQGLRTSAGMQTYAQWLGSQPSLFAGQTRRLRPSSVAIPGLPEVSAEDWAALAASPVLPPTLWLEAPRKVTGDPNQTLAAWLAGLRAHRPDQPLPPLLHELCLHLATDALRRWRKAQLDKSQDPEAWNDLVQAVVKAVQPWL